MTQYDGQFLQCAHFSKTASVIIVFPAPRSLEPPDPVIAAL